MREQLTKHTLDLSLKNKKWDFYTSKQEEEIQYRPCLDAIDESSCVILVLGFRGGEFRLSLENWTRYGNRSDELNISCSFFSVEFAIILCNIEMNNS